MQIKDLKLGEKLEVSVIDNSGKNLSPYYPVKLQHINDNDTIEIDVPMINAQSVYFRKQTLVQVVIISKEGIHSFNARVLAVNNDNIPVVVLNRESEIIKIQRRSYYRLECSCIVRYRPYKLPIFGTNEDPFKTTRTIDLSGGGMCMLSKEKIDKTNFLECVIILEKDVEISAIGKVVSVKKDDTVQSNNWKVGIQFQRISEKARERVINFIFQEQLKLRRRGLV